MEERTEVTRFASEGSALLLAGRLVADGLGAAVHPVDDPGSRGLVWFVVAVPASELEHAQELAAQDHSHLLESEFPDLIREVQVCDRCGSASVVVESKRGLTAAFSRWVLGIERDSQRCLTCGTTW